MDVRPLQSMWFQKKTEEIVCSITAVRIRDAGVKGEGKRKSMAFRSVRAGTGKKRGKKARKDILEMRDGWTLRSAARKKRVTALRLEFFGADRKKIKKNKAEHRFFTKIVSQGIYRGPQKKKKKIPGPHYSQRFGGRNIQSCSR